MEQALARWYVRLPIAVVICIMSVGIAAVVISIAPQYLYADKTPGKIDLLSNIYIYVLVLGLFAGQLFMNVARAGGGRFTFGFALTKFTVRHSAAGAGVAAGQMAVIYGVVLLQGAHISVVDVQIATTLSVTVFIFVAALLEELLFRGLLYEPTAERFGEAKTAIVISLLFGAAHISNTNASVAGIINVVLAGLLLAAMRIATRTLWMPLSFHVVWNWLNGVGLGLPVSGQNFGGEILKTIPAGYSVLTGGAFGVEEGLLTTVLLIGAIPVVLAHSGSDPFVAAAEFRRRYAESLLLHPERDKSLSLDI